MIALFTDFGVSGHYVGQMKAVLYQYAPTVAVVDLMHDAPAFDPQTTAYLLAALVGEFPADTVFLCVVDPGVGSERKPLVVKAGQQWFVGPDNGLFNIVIQQALPSKPVTSWCINWQPQRLSASFHGRDLFAPVAAKLATQAQVPGEPMEMDIKQINAWPADLQKIIYVDHFGNALTGVRAGSVSSSATLLVNNEKIFRAGTFSDVAVGQGFWFENANGLVEIAVNQGRADQYFGLAVGESITIKAD